MKVEDLIQTRTTARTVIVIAAFFAWAVGNVGEDKVVLSLPLVPLLS